MNKIHVCTKQQWPKCELMYVQNNSGLNVNKYMYVQNKSGLNVNKIHVCTKQQRRPKQQLVGDYLYSFIYK